MSALITIALGMGMAASVSLRDTDVRLVADHAQAICPVTIDQTLSDRERGRTLANFMKARNYSRSQKLLLGRLCTIWLRGYVEGARRGPVD